MEQQQTASSKDLDANRTETQGVLLQGTPGHTQNRVGEHAPRGSFGSEAALAKKADAVLQQELQGRSNRDNNHMPDDVFPMPMDLESTLHLLLQRETDFAGTLMKVLKQRPEQLTQIASQLANMPQTNTGNEFLLFPLLKVSSPVNAGNVGQIEFSLINDNESETVDYALHTTDLVGMDGQRISATSIDVSPNTSTIRPGDSLDGQIEIQVPPDIPPGTYTGLLLEENVNRLRALIELLVGP